MDTVRIECDNWRCVWIAGEAAKHPHLAVSCGVEGPVTVDGVWARPGPLRGAPSERRRQHAETQRHWSMAFGPAGLWGARLEVVGMTHTLWGISTSVLQDLSTREDFMAF